MKSEHLRNGWMRWLLLEPMRIITRKSLIEVASYVGRKNLISIISRSNHTDQTLRFVDTTIGIACLDINKPGARFQIRR